MKEDKAYIGDEIEDYILQTPINFFGTFVPAGTKFIKHGKDYWWHVINDAHCPNLQVSFMIVRNNPTYFKIISNE